MRVVEAVSDVRGVEPIELDPSLEDCIDTDAIQRLARHDGDEWKLSFDFVDHRVTVTGDGWIRVDGERVNRWKVSGDGDAGIAVP